MKIALISGVSGGIGKATAEKFIQNGYFVIGQYNTDQRTCQELLEKYPENFFGIKADLSDEGQILGMLQTLDKSFKHIDVVVNNAGVSLVKLITETQSYEWDKLFNVNVKATYLITNHALKSMIERKKGKIVNISSMWGVVGSSMEVAYSASKSALIGYTKALAKEVGPSGITVNCVCPGVINTKMNAWLSREEVDEIKEQTPLGRIGTPNEVAELIYFLSSDNADFITGQVITIDGGYIL